MRRLGAFGFLRTISVISLIRRTVLEARRSAATIREVISDTGVVDRIRGSPAAGIDTVIVPIFFVQSMAHVPSKPMLRRTSLALSAQAVETADARRSPATSLCMGHVSGVVVVGGHAITAGKPY